MTLSPYTCYIGLVQFVSRKMNDNFLCGKHTIRPELFGKESNPNISIANKSHRNPPLLLFKTTHNGIFSHADL